MEVTIVVYYVNKNAQVNGDHEVHKFNCTFIPGSQYRLFPGHFDKKTNCASI